MRRALSAGALFVAAAFSLISTGAAFTGIPHAHAATSGLQNGANITSASSGDFASASFDQSLKNLAATGANYVSLNIPLYQSNVSSTDLQPNWNAPSPQTLAGAIQYAHSVGLQVMLKFDVYPGDGQWSAYINPSNRSQWFANYLTTITPYVKAAQANGAEEICIGDELIDMATDVNSTNAANWNSLIGSVRGMYTGKLTYSANWGDSGWADEKDHIQFWSSLDYIGLSAYFNLSGDGSVASLTQSWSSWAPSVSSLASKWNKKVIFTEIGYKAIQDSYTHPWMWWEGGSADQAQQANDYQALFQYWDSQPAFAGVELWNWSSDPNAGGSGNNDYTPQGKTAESVMKQFFTSQSSSGGSGGTGSGGATASFSANASATPSSPSVGQSVSIALTVSASNGTASGANVDAEIYNASGGQVLQKVFSGQDFAAGTSKSYSLSWTPAAAGTYTVKVGVFSGDWSQDYYWNNDAATVDAGSGSSSGGGGSTGGGNGSSTGAETVNIWWPSNGATVSGVQPFKAMVTNLSVDSYSMYWQVDGGQLNPMATNNTDYPHKEASVDVTPWNWRGNGPYVVTFVAKDQNGNVIGSANSTIYN